MKQRYKKPTGVPEQFIEATRHGWIDNRTGEVLESIPNLVARLADYEKYMADLEKLHEESDTDALSSGVNTFEVHKPSKSLELQGEQEVEAKQDLINHTTVTDTIKEAPKADTVKEKVGTTKEKAATETKGRGKGRGKAQAQEQAQETSAGSSIVIR